MANRNTEQTRNRFKKSFGGSVQSLAGGKGRTFFTLEHRSETSKHKIGQQNTFTSDYIELGRDPKCALSFGPGEKTVSRRHAAIVKEGGHYVLKNLSETNPTLINNKPVAKKWYLKSGDEFQLSMEGPRIAFLVPENNTVKSLPLSARFDAFRHEALRPYKRGLVSILLIFIIAIGSLSYILWQQDKAREMLAGNLKEMRHADSVSQETIDSLREANQKNQELIAQMRNRMASLNTQVEEWKEEEQQQSGDQSTQESESRNDNQPEEPSDCSLNPYYRGVYYIQTTKVVAEMENETKEIPDFQWSGTGFLLEDGRFVTARHVVEPWVFINKDDPSNLKLNLNIIANNFGTVTAHFKAYSPDGTRFTFTNTDCRFNEESDEISTILDEENNEYTIKLAKMNSSDWAVFETNKDGGLHANPSLSQNLQTQDKLHILGYPWGFGANENDISPVYSQCPVGQSGLHQGVIRITGRSFDQGNSGGPVFYLSDSEDCNYEVIGIVSAGVGSSLGFIVPISTIN